ncbi:MAG TPA: pyridoxamine 5'-phosphate oxidase family protein [Marmoricola sp.]|nr:pyridoxamine 5'-phosphate oxidase family protein [Marmoricola sp.]
MLYELSRPECEDLLRASTVVRVAFVAPDGPHIVPVNYAVVDDAVVLRTASSSLLGVYGAGALLALEIDGFDNASEQGWSVVVRGVGEVIDDVSTGRVSLPRPRPWALGRKTRVLRVAWTELSGRRTGSGWSVLNPSLISGQWFSAVRPLELGERESLMPRVRRRLPW